MSSKTDAVNKKTAEVPADSKASASAESNRGFAAAVKKAFSVAAKSFGSSSASALTSTAAATAAGVRFAELAGQAFAETASATADGRLVCAAFSQAMASILSKAADDAKNTPVDFGFGCCGSMRTYQLRFNRFSVDYFRCQDYADNPRSQPVKRPSWPTDPVSKTTTITIGFLDEPSDTDVAKVKAAYNEWTAGLKLNLIVDWTDDANDADVRIRFAAGSGSDSDSWSCIGTDALSVKDKTKPTMQIGTVLPDGYTSNGLIKHLLGHMFGFEHEYYNPNKPFKFNLNAVFADKRFHYKNSGWTKAAIIAHYLVPIAAWKLVTASQFYNPNSIMQYDFPAGWIQGGATIKTCNELTAFDRAKLWNRYKSGNDRQFKAEFDAAFDASDAYWQSKAAVDDLAYVRSLRSVASEQADYASTCACGICRESSAAAISSAAAAAAMSDGK